MEKSEINAKNELRCCFTGHRPSKIKISEQDIIVTLEKEIRTAVKSGVKAFITGMAQGIDIYAAEIVIKLRNEGFPLTLIAASPFCGFERGWDVQWRERYYKVLKEANEVFFISSHYHKGCFQMRNEWMVNHSSQVIAVFSGEKGGTKNTIDYAKKKGILVKNILQKTTSEM